MSTEEELIKIRRILTFTLIPLVLYLLYILSMIFIPFTFGFFGMLLFSPIMRWMKNKRVPNFIGVFTVVVIVVIGIFFIVVVVGLAGQELKGFNNFFKEKAIERYDEIIHPIIEGAGLTPKQGETQLHALLSNEKISGKLFGNIGFGLNIATKFITTLLMSLFFMFLLLAGSLNIQKLSELVLFKKNQSPVRVIRQIEKDAFKFMAVKTLMSLITGIGFSITCYLFDVSFPIFWGVIAFLANFIQVVGSIGVVLALTVFGLIELNLTGNLLFFCLVLVAIEVVVGGVLEPIFLGKSFSINTLSILIMLTLWGLIWGIPGMVLAVPITALIKNIMDQFPSSKRIARLLSS